MSTQESTPLPAICPSSKPAAHFIAELLYDNYVFNRRNSPEISPERWRKVYGAQIADVMELRYQAAIKRLFELNPVPELPRVRSMSQHNYSVRCDASDVSFGQTGENSRPCGKPTLRCPGCGDWSGLCEDHLFEQADGTRVCVECDGNPEFRVPKYSVASELDADNYDAEFRQAQQAVR